MFKRLCLVLLLFCLFIDLAQTKGDNCDFDYFPKPKSCSIGQQENQQQNILPCKIAYTGIQDQSKHQHVYQLINFYHKTHFKCETFNLLNQFKSFDKSKRSYSLDIQIADPTLRSVFTLEEESYSLEIDKGQAKIVASTYVGFVRGFETFVQTFFCEHDKVCSLRYLPITIDDQPQYLHRGMMIDSGHNFIPFDIVLETIDSLMYNKMNVLHWQIINEDAFTVALQGYPQLARFGAEDQNSIYTVQNIKYIVNYALIRGVRIVPEINLAYNARYWGKAYQFEDIVVKVGSKMKLDLTMDRSYEVLRGIYAELIALFPDPDVHMGIAEDINQQGFQNRSQILDSQNLPQNANMLTYYKRRQKQQLQSVLQNKTIIYWIKRFDNLFNILKPNDVIHWYGSDYPNWKVSQKMIISMNPLVHLNKGFSGENGDADGNYVTWKRIYQNLLKNDGSNSYEVLGMEGLLWSYTTSRHSHHYKLWMRGGSIAEKLWNSNVTQIFPDVMQRMIDMQLIMLKRGIEVGAVTTQSCEINIQFCSKL